jgi:hypothetical protein
MNKKKLEGKLSLNKQTIARLSKDEMDWSKGRGTGYPCGTRTCTPTKCWCETDFVTCIC